MKTLLLQRFRVQYLIVLHSNFSMNIFQRISSEIGGPICHIISFSNVHDIFPNFLLASSAFTDAQIDFALENMRPIKAMDYGRPKEGEGGFFYNLFKDLLKNKIRLNENLLIKLLRLKILDLKMWWGIPEVNASLSQFAVFVCFGCRKVVDFCVEEKFEIHPPLNERIPWQHNRLSYIALYSTVDCLEWYLEAYNLELGEVDVRWSVLSGNMKMFHYFVSKLGKDCYKPRNFNKVSSKLFDEYGRDEKEIVEVFRALCNLYHSIDEDEFVGLFDTAYVHHMTNLVEFCVEQIQSRLGKGPEKLLEIVKSHSITNQQSINYLYENYSKPMESLEIEADSRNYSCKTSQKLLNYAFFGQTSLLKQSELFEKNSSEEELERLLLVSCERGYLENVKIIIEHHLLRESSILKAAFLKSVRSGPWIDISIFLMNDTRFRFEDIPDSFVPECLEMLKNRPNENVLLKYNIVTHRDLYLRNDYDQPYYKAWDSDKNEDFKKECFNRIFKILIEHKAVDPTENDFELVKLCLGDHCYHSLATLFLTEDPRVFGQTDFFQHFLFPYICSNNYVPDNIIELVLSNESVDPTEDDCGCLREIKNLKVLYHILQLKGKKEVDPSVRNNFLMRYLSVQGYSFFMQKEFLIHVLRILLSDDRVDPAVDDNFVARHIFENTHYWEIVKLLLDDERVDISANSYEGLKRAVKEENESVVAYLLGKEAMNECCVANDDDEFKISFCDFEKAKKKLEKKFVDLSFQEGFVEKDNEILRIEEDFFDIDLSPSESTSESDEEDEEDRNFLIRYRIMSGEYTESNHSDDEDI